MNRFTSHNFAFIICKTDNITYLVGLGAVLGGKSYDWMLWHVAGFEENDNS